MKARLGEFALLFALIFVHFTPGTGSDDSDIIFIGILLISNMINNRFEIKEN